MKTMMLQCGGKWTAVLPPTQEQQAEMESATAEHLAQVTESLRQPAFAADEAAAQAIYDQHKIEGAALISCDITLPEGTGIINCRVDGEHKQIRF
jgi:hypothetical protein